MRCKFGKSNKSNRRTINRIIHYGINAELKNWQICISAKEIKI